MFCDLNGLITLVGLLIVMLIFVLLGLIVVCVMIMNVALEIERIKKYWGI
jgi:hypothetical protein